MTIPNGWHIKYNPKPIPLRGHDWDFWHDEVDNDSRLCGTAGSEENAKMAIMEKQAERHGFDKYADEPDDFDSHINIESLRYIIAEQEAELVKLRNLAEVALHLYLNNRGLSESYRKLQEKSDAWGGLIIALRAAGYPVGGEG